MGLLLLDSIYTICHHVIYRIYIVSFIYISFFTNLDSGIDLVKRFYVH